MPDEFERIESDWTPVAGEFHWRCRAHQEMRLVIEPNGKARVELRCSNCKTYKAYPLTFSTVAWAKDMDADDVS